MTNDEIKRALTSGNGTHQGAKVTAGLSERQVEDLQILGYVGRTGGLTRKGSILARRYRDAALEAAFG